MARATAARSSASSASVELTKTRKRWSGVRIASLPGCSSVIYPSRGCLPSNRMQAPSRARRAFRAALTPFVRRLQLPRPLGRLGDLSQHLAHGLVLRLDRDVGLGHHANEPILVVHDRQAPHLMLCHQLKRVRKIVIGPHRHELARRDLPSRHTSRILPFGDRSNDDVAIGDHSRELVPIEDGNRAYVFSLHQLGDLTERRIGRRAARARGHHIAYVRSHCSLLVYVTQITPAYVTARACDAPGRASARPPRCPFCCQGYPA